MEVETRETTTQPGLAAGRDTRGDTRDGQVMKRVLADSLHQLTGGKDGRGMSESLRRKNGPAYEFRDLWDKGIPETAGSVHPAGNPIIHSKKRGFTWPARFPDIAESCSFSGREFFACVAALAFPDRVSRAVGVGSVPACRASYPCKTVRRSLRLSRSASETLGVDRCFGSALVARAHPNLFGFVLPSPDASNVVSFAALHAFGVGSMRDDPNTVALVRGAEGTRRYAIPFSVIPALGQVSENGIQSISNESCHVLHNRVARSNHANGTHKFPVKSRTGPGKAGALPGARHVLAGEAADNNVCIGELGGADVIDDWNSRPMLRQHTPAERIDLAERHGLKAARAFEAEVKAANAGKQRQHLQHAALPGKDARRGFVRLAPGASWPRTWLARGVGETRPWPTLARGPTHGRSARGCASGGLLAAISMRGAVRPGPLDRMQLARTSAPRSPTSNAGHAPTLEAAEAAMETPTRHHAAPAKEPLVAGAGSMGIISTSAPPLLRGLGELRVQHSAAVAIALVQRENRALRDGFAKRGDLVLRQQILPAQHALARKPVLPRDDCPLGAAEIGHRRGFGAGEHYRCSVGNADARPTDKQSDHAPAMAARVSRNAKDSGARRISATLHPQFARRTDWCAGSAIVRSHGPQRFAHLADTATAIHATRQGAEDVTAPTAGAHITHRRSPPQRRSTATLEC